VALIALVSLIASRNNSPHDPHIFTVAGSASSHEIAASASAHSSLPSIGLSQMAHLSLPLWLGRGADAAFVFRLRDGLRLFT
jgi:hypothetical protein